MSTCSSLEGDKAGHGQSSRGHDVLLSVPRPRPPSRSPSARRRRRSSASSSLSLSLSSTPRTSVSDTDASPTDQQQEDDLSCGEDSMAGAMRARRAANDNIVIHSEDDVQRLIRHKQLNMMAPSVRSMSVPNALLAAMPQVTVTDFSAMAAALMTQTGPSSAFAVTLDDVAPFRQMWRRPSAASSTCTSLMLGSEDAWSCGNSICDPVDAHDDDDDDDDQLECIKMPLSSLSSRPWPWVQLAGHPDSFIAAPQAGHIMKKFTRLEQRCYASLANDALAAFVPSCASEIVVVEAEDGNKQRYLQLEDCLHKFRRPSVMDCKIGMRTYLEEDLERAEPRKDLYLKMIKEDPTAPTDQEHKDKAVTKPRYMSWRETSSSSATLFFRIDGVKKAGSIPNKCFKKVKSKQQVAGAIQNFTQGAPRAAQQYLEKLRELKSALERSTFFRTHELIGTSLLFVHDDSCARVWMIDFGKTVALPAGVAVDHRSAWTRGNHEDGYLTAIENLIDIMAEIAAKSKDSSSSNSQDSLEEESA